MSTNKKKQPLTPDEIKKKARKILQENPTFIKEEPSVVGSPDSLTEDLEKENERTDQKSS